MTDIEKALTNISYGVYIISSVNAGKLNAMVANSVIQATAEPAKIAVTVNNNSLTCEYITSSGRFCAHPLAQSVQMSFIGNFGFRTGRNFNKFESVKYALNANGLPIVLENVLSAMEVKVETSISLGTHTMFAGPLISARVLDDKSAPLTYSYYHNILRGKTPVGATTFKANQKEG